MRMFWVKARRCVLRTPSAAWRAFYEPIFNTGQVLTFIIAVVGLALILQNATPEERDMQAVAWSIAVQSFGYACVGWAIISLLRAPLIVIRSDQSRGTWHGKKFVYHQPLLVATIHCSHEHNDRYYEFSIPDAEKDCFVYCTVEMDRPVNNAWVQVGGFMFAGNKPAPGSWSEFRLLKGRKAKLIVNELRQFHDFTVRVYCHQFEVI